MRKLVLICIGVLLLVTAITAAAPRHNLPPVYQTARVSRGEAVTRVIAAGTVQAVVSVVVGSQVSGQVKEVLVDHNDPVSQGQPIALLDPQLFDTRVEQARAEVDVANDAVRIAKDEVTAAEAALNRVTAESATTRADKKRHEVATQLAQSRLERKSVLMNRSVSSASDVEDARAAYDSAVAELDAATAQIASQEVRIEEAKAQLTVTRSRVSHFEAQRRRNQAALRQAEADLDRTVIRAPMDGVVIERSATTGQTVAASFQAPTLFTIGDLRTANVEISVDEADIGGLRVGQTVTFSVDAYPDKSFAGRITQIRKAPHTQESVVTYTVVAATDNAGFLLFPGMTAKAEIVTAETPDALQVPTAALRYRPKHVPQPPGSHVWLLQNEGIHPVAVKVGMGVSGDGMTEIIAGRVAEGDTVVTGEAQSGGSPAGAILGFSAAWMEQLSAAVSRRWAAWASL